MTSGQASERPGEQEKIEDAIYNVVVDHPMWIDDEKRPLDYLPEREALIGDFVEQAGTAVMAELSDFRAAVLSSAAQAIEDDKRERTPSPIGQETDWEQGIRTGLARAATVVRGLAQ